MIPSIWQDRTLLSTLRRWSAAGGDEKRLLLFMERVEQDLRPWPPAPIPAPRDSDLAAIAYHAANDDYVDVFKLVTAASAEELASAAAASAPEHTGLLSVWLLDGGLSGLAVSLRPEFFESDVARRTAALRSFKLEALREEVSVREEAVADLDRARKALADFEGES